MTDQEIMHQPHSSVPLPFLAQPASSMLSAVDRHNLSTLASVCRSEHALIHDPLAAKAAWSALTEADPLRCYDALHAVLLTVLGHPGVDGVRTPHLDAFPANDAARLREIIHQHRRLMRFSEDHPLCDHMRRAFTACVARPSAIHAF